MHISTLRHTKPMMKRSKKMINKSGIATKSKPSKFSVSERNAEKINVVLSLLIAILIAGILHHWIYGGGILHHWIYGGGIFKSVSDEGECCQNPLVKHDFDHLSNNLSLDLFGQHLVTENTFEILKAHIKNEQTKKPLVLSFHGSPGTGKTFASKLIAESFYKFGSKQTVFFNIQEHYENYDQDVILKQTIESTVSRCKYALFIFEEAHLMNPKLLDVMLPYVNYPSPSYNRAIFIFLSKSGAYSINEYVIEKMKVGRKRESITLEEMHNLLHSYIIKTEKPFKGTEFVAQNLVDAYIPFLPLERQHVRECVYAIMRQKHLKFDDHFVDSILTSISYFPETYPLFASTGCKRLEYIIADHTML